MASDTYYSDSAYGDPYTSDPYAQYGQPTPGDYGGTPPWQIPLAPGVSYDQYLATLNGPTAAPTAPTDTPAQNFQFRDYASTGAPMAPEYSPAPDFNFSYDPFSYDAFQAPDANSIYGDPGYQFRQQQGQKALEQSAAARGTLRTGGTLKDLLNYGQSLASQEYGNVFNRARQTWGANRDNAFQNYTTNYTNARQAALDSYAPKLASWNQNNHGTDLAFQRAWENYTYGTPSATTIYNGGLS